MYTYTVKIVNDTTGEPIFIGPIDISVKGGASEANKSKVVLRGFAVGKVFIDGKRCQVGVNVTEIVKK